MDPRGACYFVVSSPQMSTTCENLMAADPHLAVRLQPSAASGRRRPPERGNIRRENLAVNNNRAKYESVTLRVTTPVIEIARLGAEEEGISLNSLANRQLRQYADWDRLERKLGYVTVRDRVFRLLLERLPEEDIAPLGKRLGEIEVREYVTLNWGRMAPERILDFVDSYARYSGQFRVEHHRQGQHTLVLFHRLGPKWSLYLEAFMLSAIQAALGQRARAERTEDSVTLTFSLPTGGNSRARNGRSNNTSPNSSRANRATSRKLDE